ncbi:hypothetical protein OL548_19915 [Lysinibacillus sp. MHQ-1]|nr:hypothetical protein OL548_19915 [Lysinibacillus sp. MHQ-1]
MMFVLVVPKGGKKETIDKWFKEVVEKRFAEKSENILKHFEGMQGVSSCDRSHNFKELKL